MDVVAGEPVVRTHVPKIDVLLNVTEVWIWVAQRSCCLAIVFLVLGSKAINDSLISSLDSI